MAAPTARRTCCAPGCASTAKCAPPARCWSTCCRCCTAVASMRCRCVLIRISTPRGARCNSLPATTRVTCTKRARRSAALRCSAMARAIELYARETPGHDGRVAHAVAMLQSAASEHAGRIVLASSLGAEDMVLTDLIARHHLAIAIGTLETGKLHAQTLELAQRVEQHYGLTIELHRPQQEAVVHFVRTNGDDAMYRSVELRKACCALRKLEPLKRMLDGRTAWVTGLRREQSDARGAVPFSEVDEHGRTKLSPLADWTWNDVWH